MKSDIRSIAIIGAGPAGSTLATLLAQNGKEVVVFDSDKRPSIVVGESLIPAVIPILRKLNLEDEVKSFSMLKPGATFLMDETENHYGFHEFGKKLPGYAYNVPRDQFDAAVLNAARSAGATVIPQSARLELDAKTGQPKLTDECRAIIDEHVSTDGPDLIVDASGRKRLFSNMMKIPSRSGNRSDAVLFAHIESADTTVPGNIHIGRLQHGWNWFIPLPGRMSVGFVMNHERLQEYGDSNEERYDN
ncbi:MAG: tryptophan 7-halogenase, partial [Candidatus Hydrogenedentota bacterium]